MNNYLMDNHFHLSLSDDIETIIDDAKRNNVQKFIISGCDCHSIMDGLEIVHRYNDIYLTIGFHPSEVDSVTDKDISVLENLIVNNPKIVGIGEIGLDYYYNDSNIEQQKDIFEKQLQLAEKLNLPVVIHSRESIQDTYDILCKYHLRGVIHCFSGSLEMAELFIKLEFYLGIGGVLTFKNSKLKEVVEQVSLENLVLETDSPYLSPEPYRGQENSPKNIKIIANTIAKIKNISLDEVTKVTTKNSNSLFDFVK